MNEFLRNLFGEASRRNEPQREGVPTFQKNDLIAGEFEVLRTLGKGGFGMVLLVYCRNTCEVAALKTFRNELLADPAARHAFKKEALMWLNLEWHPFIVAALLVTEDSGRLFVLLEFIAPDAQGRVSLADHLARTRGPLDANQVLTWAIQFCGSSTFLMGKVGEIGFSGGAYDTGKSVSSDIGAGRCLAGEASGLH